MRRHCTAHVEYLQKTEQWQPILPVGSRSLPGWPVLWPHWDVWAQNSSLWFLETAHKVELPSPAFPVQHTSNEIIWKKKQQQMSSSTNSMSQCHVSLCVYRAWPGVWVCMPERGGLGTGLSFGCLMPSRTCPQQSRTLFFQCAAQPGCWETVHSLGDLGRGHADASPENGSRRLWLH